jgi:hypothetical protein
MNPRNNPKADTYILAWKGILHRKELNRLTMQRKLRQKYLVFMGRILIKT